MIRIGKPARDFISELIKDDGICLLTRSTGTQEDYGPWSRALQALGLVPDGKSIASMCKYQFFREYFSIIEMRDVNGDLLGYYCDLCTPLHEENGIFIVTDLLLDLWISPGGTPSVLDMDEFESAVASGELEPALEEQACKTVRRLLKEVAEGKFPSTYI